MSVKIVIKNLKIEQDYGDIKKNVQLKKKLQKQILMKKTLL